MYIKSIQMILKINKDETNLTGIYQIKNIINEKVYVGSTRASFKKRAHGHSYLLNKNIHHSQHLQKSFNEYGTDNFEFSVLEVCSSINIEEKEQYWINIKKSHERDFGYNILKFAYNSTEYKHTKETIKKISENSKNRIPHLNTLNAMWNSSRGKKRSKEHIDIIRKTHIRPVIQMNLSGDVIKEWESITEVNKFFNLPTENSNISKCCKNGKSLKGFLWVKKEDYDENKNYSYVDKRFKNNI